MDVGTETRHRNVPKLERRGGWAGDWKPKSGEGKEDVTVQHTYNRSPREKGGQTNFKM